MVMADATDKGK